MSNSYNLDNIQSLSDSNLLDILCSNNISFTEENISDIKEVKKKEDVKSICKNCNNTDLLLQDTINGIIVCTGCGEVVDNIINMTAEWSNYDNIINSSVDRCKSFTNPHLPKSSLGTNIGGKWKTKLMILNQWNSMPYDERSLNTVLKMINSVCRNNNILKCIEDDAKIMYKNISKITHDTGKNKGNKVIFRGINRESLIASCVFYACIRKGVTRSPSEIALMFGIGYTDMTNGMKLFQKLLRMMNTNLFSIGSSFPEHFIPRYCKKLKLSGGIRDVLLKITINIRKINMASTHNPKSIAVGCIWIVIDKFKLPITKKMISEIFKISEVTISKTYQILYPYYDILIDDDKVNNVLEILKKERDNIQVPQDLNNTYRLLTIDIDKNIPNIGNIDDDNEFNIKYANIKKEWNELMK